MSRRLRLLENTDSIRTILKSAYNVGGLRHVLGRGLEFACLQTKITAAAYWKITPILYRFKYTTEATSYDAPIDIFSLRWVDPENIDSFSVRVSTADSRRAARHAIGDVRDGDWDRKSPETDGILYADTVSETLLYQGMQNRFLDGKRWEDTDFFYEIVDRVERGQRLWHGCETQSDVKRRCQHIDDLYDRIRSNGYQTQQNLHGLKPEISAAFGFLNSRLEEITVDIARDGEFQIVDSRHRLMIARILELDIVPITVLVRHKKWMNHRDRVYRSNRRDNHPDLVEFES